MFSFYFSKESEPFVGPHVTKAKQCGSIGRVDLWDHVYCRWSLDTCISVECRSLVDLCIGRVSVDITSIADP